MFLLKIFIMSVMLAFPSFAEDETLLDEINSEITPEKINEMGDMLVEELKSLEPDKVNTELDEESSEVRRNINRKNIPERFHDIERNHQR
ncbi:hypothetical protein OAP83_00990 [Rickettsiales bacterium]|nr:hypothetical protein [Rickettsiales bacterium]